MNPPFTTHIKHERRDGMLVTTVAVVDSKGYTVSLTTDEVPLEWVQPAPAHRPFDYKGYVLRTIEKDRLIVASDSRRGLISVDYGHYLWTYEHDDYDKWWVNHATKEIVWSLASLQHKKSRARGRVRDFVPFDIEGP